MRLPSNWVADFRRLYDFGEAGRANLVVPAAKFNRAMRLDTRLVDPLAFLPDGSFGGDQTTPLIQRNLAFRNLTRRQHAPARVRPADGQPIYGPRAST